MLILGLEEQFGIACLHSQVYIPFDKTIPLLGIWPRRICEQEIPDNTIHKGKEIEKNLKVLNF